MKYYIYQTTNPEGKEIEIVFTEDGGQFPFSELNPDYRQYLMWLAEGNTPEEWQPETGDEN